MPVDCIYRHKNSNFKIPPLFYIFTAQIIFAMNYWLVKSEPHKYSWEKFNQDGRTFWDGVRNFQARNNLREMKEGDLVLFYHSNEGKEVVGIAKVVKEAYQDPTTEDPNWVVVDLSPVETLKTPVTLETIKADSRLQDISLVRQGRLSVMGLKKEEFDRILELSN
jgi:predicted RNA-binding protein with PUA-like domain